MNKISGLLLPLLLLYGALTHAAPPAEIATLQQGAAAGNAYDQLNLGAAYDHGIGVARDIDKALHWYQRAAEQGVAEAQFNLAHLLVTEEISTVAAAEWMEKAARQGLLDAEYLMGAIHAEGIGVEVNPQEARRWWQRAAARGHTEAQRLLKEMK
ncbi:MAG: sel1 repeat family protein [Gammaproteobacteria bacterium]|nr:sel1 repeat family protein [Gammaproteobacteria bacterium]